MGDLQFTADRAEMLDRSGATQGAVADEGRRLVVPLGVEVVDGVHQHTRRGMVVFRCDKDEPVVSANSCRPSLGVLASVLTGGRWNGLIQVGQRVVSEIDQFVVCAGAARGLGQTQSATALPLRPGRVLPRMIAIFSSLTRVLSI